MIDITILTLPFRVGLLIGVDAVSGQTASTVPVIAVVAHSLGKMLLVDVGTVVNPARLSSCLALSNTFLTLLFLFLFLHNNWLFDFRFYQSRGENFVSILNCFRYDSLVIEVF